MRRAVIYSFVAEFLAMLSLIATFKIAADLWGTNGFGEWALTRRFLSFLLPLVVCGLDIALPRYVAIASRGKSDIHVATYLPGALLITVITLAAASLILLPFRAPVAALLFGDQEHSDLILPLWMLMVSCALYIPSYAFLRGRMRFFEAALVHVLMFAVQPLVAMALFRDSPRAALLGLGALSTGFAICLLVYVGLTSGVRLAGTTSAARTLAAYGVKRMYAALGLLALATMPAMITANLSGLTQAGFVVFGLTLVGVAAAAAAPIGVTLLPVAAGAMAEGRLAEHHAPFRRLELAMLAASIAGIVILWVIAPAIAAVFFGPNQEDAALMLRIAVFGAGPYAYFICVRNLIDAHTEAAVNTRNIAIALAAFVLLVVIGLAVGSNDPARLTASAYTISLIVLAALTWKAAHRVFAMSQSPGAP